MGSCLSHEPEVDFEGPVGFNHFYILRAIGKGAFGKVCIVKKKDTKKMYAMKYMNKVQIIKKHAVDNVFREIELLRALDHAFLVNLWYTFQDREDIFMVLDLMLGGDLSYHLEKEGRFQVPRVRLYMAELALALDYLRERSIIHRDLKPANLLLDSSGHVHLTDFNVACAVEPDIPVTSITGTKPYMAPEIFHPGSRGYSFAVDWWSLGVTAYEMLRGQRPFPMERTMSNEDIYTQVRRSRPSASARWDQNTCSVLNKLLHPDEDKRLQQLDAVMAHPFFQSLNWEEVRENEVTPPFVPPQNRINCDPTHELEEMIVEPNPLHKKQHRLSKRHYKAEDEEVMEELDRIGDRFVEYNRENDKSKRESVLQGRLTPPPSLPEEDELATSVKITVEVEVGAEKEAVTSEGTGGGEIATGNAVSSNDKPCVSGKVEESAGKSEVMENGELVTEKGADTQDETGGASGNDDARTGVASQEESQAVDESKEGALSDRLEHHAEAPVTTESDKPSQQGDSGAPLTGESNKPDQQGDSGAPATGGSVEPDQQRDSGTPLTTGAGEPSQEGQAGTSVAQSEGSRVDQSEGHVVGEGESPGEPSGHDASTTPSSTDPNVSLAPSS